VSEPTAAPRATRAFQPVRNRQPECAPSNGGAHSCSIACHPVGHESRGHRCTPSLSPASTLPSLTELPTTLPASQRSSGGRSGAAASQPSASYCPPKMKHLVLMPPPIKRRPLTRGCSPAVACMSALFCRIWCTSSWCSFDQAAAVDARLYPSRRVQRCPCSLESVQELAQFPCTALRNSISFNVSP